MKPAATTRFLPALLIALLCASCAGVSLDEQAEALLVQADTKMSAEDYSGATALYAEFATGNPDHAQAARARATQKALDRMLSYQAEMIRSQRGSETARRELGERQAEADRLRGEVAKLRADLERLRNIDLQPLRPK